MRKGSWFARPVMKFGIKMVNIKIPAGAK